jgi:UDP-N-acetylmuramate--alanine ligase
LASNLNAGDRLWIPEIYYAGGTANRDISSRGLVEALVARGIPAFFAERKEDLLDPVASEARAGDVVLVMGARDPTLAEFSRRILERLEGRDRPPAG